MSGKKIQIGGKPTASRAAAGSADEWVSNRAAPAEAPAAPAEKMKRLTIDVTESMHREFKRKCADKGVKIADVARELIGEWVRKS
ncbi:plasmid partition protein ParG [Escherichia coli]|uniref:plasmid partition protein ParG n=1 Tax=Escherichia coli TaxID=562 RepID=UPI0029C464BB|nr:plasmid partition protein ParG [Escherichia coli]MDX5555983.1 plasmid partition protein ParG [Escherichia coli]